MNNSYQIFLGDSLEVLKNIPSSSLDSLVTDPPAGIGFQNLEWDDNKGGRDQWISWLTQIMTECLRVLKPGAHGFVWAIPRTSHWTAFALENAGFKVRDVVTHVFGSGFPKSLDLEKAILKSKHIDMDLIYKAAAWIRSRRDELGLSNKDLDEIANVRGGACHWTANSVSAQPAIPTLERWLLLEKILGPAPDWLIPFIRPAHAEGHHLDLAQDWIGWGTALKPASEHWILIQKPMEAPNTAANVLKFGTGAININATRIPTLTKIPPSRNLSFSGGKFLWDSSNRRKTKSYVAHSDGRHPANFILTKSFDESCPVNLINDEGHHDRSVSEYFKTFTLEKPFLYCKKPARFEKGEDNTHPTVKPIKLMSYLIKMITPPNGTVLDPFMGSGTTGVAALSENFKFVGIEKCSDYHSISNLRLKEILHEANQEEKIYE